MSKSKDVKKLKAKIKELENKVASLAMVEEISDVALWLRCEDANWATLTNDQVTVVIQLWDAKKFQSPNKVASKVPRHWELTDDEESKFRSVYLHAISTGVEDRLFLRNEEGNIFLNKDYFRENY